MVPRGQARDFAVLTSGGPFITNASYCLQIAQNDLSIAPPWYMQVSNTDPGQDEDTGGATDRQFATNLARGLEVLRAFSAEEPVLTNRAISERTGLPKATVSRLTYTLIQFGYLRQTETGAYTLGTAVLSLAHPLLASLSLRQAARPVLQSLAAETGCTVNLAVRERVSAIYIDSVRSDAANPYLPDVGSISPLLQSAIGRALVLGTQSGDRIQLLNRIRVADPGQYEQGIAYLRADEALNGYCRARGPWKGDIDAIAAPLPLSRQYDVAAINCTISTTVARGMDLEALAPKLLSAAQQIAVAYAARETRGGASRGASLK